MRRLELFLFRYRDPRTGKWMRARYRAERHEIAARYADFEIIGAPEIREIDPDRQRFNPHSGSPSRSPPSVAKVMQDPRPRMKARPATEDPASVDELERFLLRVFLRRYVTYRVRRRRFAAMNGAARLHAAIAMRVGGAPRPN